jgi:hypothetical protein
VTERDIGIRHPVGLDFRETGDLAEGEWMLTAVDADGTRIMISASRERWAGLFRGGRVRPSESEMARRMYERGEVEVETFESALDREQGRFDTRGSTP